MFYTADKNFTRPPVAPVAPNINSVWTLWLLYCTLCSATCFDQLYFIKFWSKSRSQGLRNCDRLKIHRHFGSVLEWASSKLSNPKSSHKSNFLLILYRDNQLLNLYGDNGKMCLKGKINTSVIFFRLNPKTWSSFSLLDQFAETP